MADWRHGESATADEAADRGAGRGASGDCRGAVWAESFVCARFGAGGCEQGAYAGDTTGWQWRVDAAKRERPSKDGAIYLGRGPGLSDLYPNGWVNDRRRHRSRRGVR